MFPEKHYSAADAAAAVAANAPAGMRASSARKLGLYNLPSFWTLQLLGWSAYGFHRWLINPDFFDNKFIYLLVGFTLTSLVRYFYRELWRRNRSLYFILPVLVSVSVAGGVIYVLMSRLILVLLGFAVFPEQAFHRHLFEAFQNSFLHNKTFVFFSWSALYFGIKYWRDTARLREQSYNAEITARDAQLEMLRYQINPHFLFNSLNSIHALVARNPAGAEKMIERLSALLRYSLSNGEIFQTTLQEEFEIARKYLEIEKIRFEEALVVEQSIEPEAREILVPSFIIHPLVENAVKYGMRDSGDAPARVKLSAQKRGSRIYIEIANTGHLRQDKKTRTNCVSGESIGNGIGLENVRRRLEVVFGENCDFSIFESDGWVRAAIEIKTDAARSFGTKEMEGAGR